MLIWIIFFLPLSIYSSLLTLEDLSVVTFYNYTPPLYINSVPYRESVLPIIDKAIFSLNMKPGKYSINDSGNSINDIDKYIPTIIDQVRGRFTNGLTKDYLIKNESSIHLDSLVFRVNTTERYRLSGSVGAWKKRSNKKLPKITYELDGEILREDEGSVSIITTRLLTPGIHRYNSWITGIKNEYWCVCPSLNRGYLTTHWLGVWRLPKKYGERKEKVNSSKIEGIFINIPKLNPRIYSSVRIVK